MTDVGRARQVGGRIEPIAPVAPAAPAPLPAQSSQSGQSAHAGPSGGTLHSLRTYPDFRLLLSGTLATNSAFWMYQVAAGWLALDLTDSALFVGLTGFAGGIPLLLLSIPAGVAIDRVDRRVVLRYAQWGVMVVSALFALLVATDLIAPWSMLVLCAAYGTAMSFVFPTRTAIVPSLVERTDLANAIALNAAAQNATRVVGPALAGILIAIVGVTGSFAVAALLQILALSSTGRLPDIAAGGTSRRAAGKGNLTHGLRIVAADPFLVGLILMALATNVLVMPYINLMPVFARDELDVGSTGLGFLLASTGVGTVLGALWVARSARLVTWHPAQPLSAAVFTVLVLIFSFSPSVASAVPVLFAAGCASAAFLAINQTSLQLRVADESRGRVLSIYLLTWGMLPLGQLLVGALADWLGTPPALAIACVGALIWIAIVVIRVPATRR